jgi:hypothetical protein
MSALFTWFLRSGWQPLVAFVVAAVLAYAAGYWQGNEAGYARHDAEVNRKTMEKLNDAISADDAHRSRLNDPDYRLQDDGFKRRE